MRLDVYVSQQTGITSRQKAKELILQGAVSVDGQNILKPSYEVDPDAILEIDRDSLYVSRAALKLKGFLKDCPEIEISGRRILDIGSSTGGFAQILLESGASCVVCVDVGHSQLHPSLRDDVRIISHENTDIRDFYDDAFELVTCDVSFISLSYLIEPLKRLCAKEAILLFKPQFEVGRDVKRNAKGVLLDKKASLASLQIIIELFVAQGFRFILSKPSIIKGKAGNEETFVYFQR